MDKEQRDVTILGGGLAGLSLALQCKQEVSNARITVLEKNDHPVPEAAFKVGESTVEVGANYFAQVLGLEQHIVEEQLPKLGLRFFFGSGDNSSVESRLEMGSTRFAPAPSYQLDRGRFENFLGERASAMGIEFVDRAKVKKIELGSGRDHRVEYERDGQSIRISTRWVADASGRAGLLKRQLGFKMESPHKANAVWFRVGRRIKIDDWSDDATWQGDYTAEAARWYSTNHLMGEGYWVWLIPLASGSTSVGIVADDEIHPLSTYNSMEKALLWLQKYEPQCAEKVLECRDEVQDFLAVKQYPMECKQVFSRERWGMTGEAGFFLDPFYSPGSDFIAMGNTFLSDLIRRDLNGNSIRLRSHLYDKIYKRFYHGTLAIYQDQYQVFGHHQAMPVKIAWDYLIYWSLTGLVFMQGRLCDIYMYPWHQSKLKRIAQLNHAMQAYFRRWCREIPAEEVPGAIDISSIPLIREMNDRLLDDLNRREFNRRFADNVKQLEVVFWEIVDQVGLEVDVPFKRRPHPHVKQNTLESVFRVTHPESASHAKPAEAMPIAS